MMTYSGPRRCGKTTALIKKWEKYGGIILVHGYSEQDRIIREYKIPRSCVMTHSQALNNQELLRGHSNIYIDNLEIFLEQALRGHTLEFFATFTGRDISPRNTPLWKAVNGVNE